MRSSGWRLKTGMVSISLSFAGCWSRVQKADQHRLSGHLLGAPCSFFCQILLSKDFHVFHFWLDTAFPNAELTYGWDSLKQVCEKGSNL